MLLSCCEVRTLCHNTLTSLKKPQLAAQHTLCTDCPRHPPLQLRTWSLYVLAWPQASVFFLTPLNAFSSFVSRPSCSPKQGVDVFGSEMGTRPLIVISLAGPGRNIELAEGWNDQLSLLVWKSGLSSSLLSVFLTTIVRSQKYIYNVCIWKNGKCVLFKTDNHVC